MTKLTLFVSALFISLLVSGKTYAASLTFSPSSLEMDKGKKKSVTLVLDTAGQKVFGIIATVKITSGSDKIRLSNVQATSSITLNGLKVEDGTSADDSIISFTALNETFAFFTGNVSIATFDVEGLKDGNAKFEVVTDGVSNPSTVSEYEVGNELLATKGSVTIKVNDEDDEDDEDDNNDDDNDNNSSSTTTNSSTNTTSTTTKGGVPQTGSNEVFLASIVGLVMAGGSLVARKFIKA